MMGDGGHTHTLQGHGGGGNAKHPTSQAISTRTPQTAPSCGKARATRSSARRFGCAAVAKLAIQYGNMAVPRWTLTHIDLVNASMLAWPFKRPLPLAPTPPKGTADSSAMVPLLT